MNTMTRPEYAIHKWYADARRCTRDPRDAWKMAWRASRIEYNGAAYF